MKKLLLIDGNSLLFRAYYATLGRSMMTSNNNIPVNAIYSFSMLLNNVIDKLKPEYLLVAFDTGEKTFRSKLYPEYKGTRKELPEELIIQFPIAREFLSKANIFWYEQVGYEADDIIGTLAQNPEYEINVLTGDKDLLQLVKPNVKVWMMRKGVSDLFCFDEEAVFELYGLTPLQIIDLKGLMGDPSDNIPGVKGVGEKTALKLLKEYQSVENVLASSHELKGKIKENIENGKEIALLSKTLATINTEVPLEISVADLKYKISYPGLAQFYLKYGFKSLLKGITPYLETEETIISDVMIDDDLTCVYFDYDKEFNLHGIIIDNKYYKYEGEIVQEVKQALSNEKIKVVYNLKELYHLVNNYDIAFSGPFYDLMIASFLIDNSINSWENFCFKYGITLKQKQLDLFAEDESLKKMDFVLKFPEIYHETLSSLKADAMDSLFYDLEMPLVEVLFLMEEIGIKMDKEGLLKYAETIKTILKDYEAKVISQVGHDFNLNSPKQLAEVLFDELGLPLEKKRSTAIEVLEKLEPLHPVIKDLIGYRKYQKIFSTYASGLLKYIEDDGRIHTVYNQTVTQTGRLSSNNPNLQNISVRSEEGREVRRYFLADTDSVLLAADYSQVELRILAHLAKEDKLIQAFKNNEDIHASTAREIFHLASNALIDGDLRRKAKAVNFGIIYGISDFGLAQQLDISKKEASEYIERYFKIYPKIKAYMDGVVADCQKDGYVKTILNRRRYIPEIKSSNYMTKEFGKRAAMNAPIQGSAADLIKIAMINVDRKLRKQDLASRILLQVHDELVVNVKLSELKIVTKIIEEEMCQALKLEVPLIVDINTGLNWYEVK